MFVLQLFIANLRRKAVINGFISISFNRKDTAFLLIVRFKNIIMKHQINVSCGGVGFLGLLTIVFITLKLCNVINWSWWWVTMPLWVFPVACLWGGRLL